MATALAKQQKVIAERLAAIAKEVEASHRTVESTARTTLEAAVNCGQLLIAAKALVQHGEWLAWLENNTTIAPRRAQGYMRLGRRQDQIDWNIAGIRSQLDILASARQLMDDDERDDPLEDNDDGVIAAYEHEVAEAVVSDLVALKCETVSHFQPPSPHQGCNDDDDPGADDGGDLFGDEAPPDDAPPPAQKDSLRAKQFREWLQLLRQVRKEWFERKDWFSEEQFARLGEAAGNVAGVLEEAGECE